MAIIKPFCGWRYAPHLSTEIGNLTSPLFDVVSDKQRQKLYQNELNSIHLSVPQCQQENGNTGEGIGECALRKLNEWKASKIIEQDTKPAIYVYYQYFFLPDSKKEYCRKGFISFIKATDWEENVVLRHENTIPHAVNDRTELLAKTLFHASATHGLYTDEAHELEVLMDRAMQKPIYETEDYQGVRDVLAIIEEEEEIKKFVQKIATQQIILADGHHRYESSLALKHRLKSQNPNHTGEELYNYHLMYLTNAAADDLRILPTHRLLVGLPNFEEENFIAKMYEFFEVKEIENSTDLAEVIAGKKWTFGIVTKNKAFKIKLKPEKIDLLHWEFPQVVKEIDLTVMHYFIIYKLLGIKGKDQRSTSYLRFERNFTECLNKVLRQETQLAIITNEVEIEDVKNVCKSGYTMPQKSTYFYPKVICGFVFADIQS
jgi:uncharacterized protein (DUF1015 family)